MPRLWLRELSTAESQGVFEGYTLPALETVCQGRGLPVDPKLTGANRVKHAAALAAVFNDRDSIDRALSRLSPAARYGLALIKGANGLVNRAEWRQRVGVRFGMSRDQAEQELVGLALALYAMPTNDRLVLSDSIAKQSVGKPGFYDAWLVVFAPVLDRFLAGPELQKLLQPELPSLYQEQEQELTPATPADLAPLLQDLFAFLRYLENGNIKLLQSGDPAKRDFGKLHGLMSVKDRLPLEDSWKINDLPRLNLLWYLLLTTGMVAGEGNGRGELFARVQTQKVAEFFALPVTQQVRALSMAWIRSQYSEFLHISSLSFINADPYSSDVPDETTLAEAREYVMRLLETMALRRHIPPGAGRWVDLAGFQTLVQELNLEVLVSRLHRPILSSYSYSFKERSGYFGNDHYNGFTSLLKQDGTGWGREARAAELEKDWKLVEGEWLAHLFREPLAWLGLAELGLNRAGLPVAWRLTELGMTVLWGDNQAESIPSPQTISSTGIESVRNLIVQPNFEVLALAPLQNMAVLHRLDRFATQESLGEVARYRINKESVLKGLRVGLTGEEMLAFLTEHSRVPLSQNLVTSVQDWSKSYDRLHLLPAVNLLEVSDPSVLDRLMAEISGSELIERRLSPTLALLKSATGGNPLLNDSGYGAEQNPAKSGQASQKSPATPGGNKGAGENSLETLLGEISPGSDRPRKLLLAMDYQQIKPGALQFEGERWLRIKAGYGTPYLNYRLGQFADLITWEAARQSALFELSHAAGKRAERLGLTYQAVAQFLEKWCGPRTDIPAAMRLVLKNWLGYYPALESYRTLSLKAAGPEQLDELFSLEEFKPLLLERASPRVALIREDLLPLYRERLEALGVVINSETSGT